MGKPLWSQKNFLVVVVTLGTNLITYAVCVYWRNYFSYWKITRCEELIMTSNLHSDMFPAQCYFTHLQSVNQFRNSSKPDNSTIDGETHKTTNKKLKTIFVITPTYKRPTQKIDLISMCHTLMNVPNVVWIIIEDAPKPTQLVTNLLQRCKVITVHLIATTSAAYKVDKSKDKALKKNRGVDQRNAGLTWLREHYSVENCSGVVYFGDDNNKFDLRLFDEIRKTEVASVWKVAWRGNLTWEGPTCENERAIFWDSLDETRVFQIDMAGFAIHLCQFFKYPEARFGVRVNGNPSVTGHLETDLLEHFTTKSEVECRGSETEVYVWHSHTSPPPESEEIVPPQKTIET